MLNLLDLALSQVLNTASDKRKKDTRKKNEDFVARLANCHLVLPYDSNAKHTRIALYKNSTSFFRMKWN